jgi:hypothetical protein
MAQCVEAFVVGNTMNDQCLEEYLVICVNLCVFYNIATARTAV